MQKPFLLLIGLPISTEDQQEFNALYQEITKLTETDSARALEKLFPYLFNRIKEVDAVIGNLVIKEKNILVTPPMKYSTVETAENEIKKSFKDAVFVGLVDLEKNILFVYKGPRINEIKKDFLPRFFNFYHAICDEQEDLFLEEIRDIRELSKYALYSEIKN